jgi:VanZ family protein
MNVSDFAQSFGVQLVVMALIGVVSMTAALVVRHHRLWPFSLEPASSCLAIGSGLAVLVGTVTPRSDARGIGRIQLVPLQTLRSYHYSPGRSDLLIYLVGNVALFLPLGFFLYLALRRWLLVTTAICALASVAVEVAQLPIWSRSTDVDDVLTNTAGGFIGALAGVLALRLIRVFRPPGGSGTRAGAEPRTGTRPGARPSTPTYAVGSRAS